MTDALSTQAMKSTETSTTDKRISGAFLRRASPRARGRALSAVEDESSATTMLVLNVLGLPRSNTNYRRKCDDCLRYLNRIFSGELVQTFASGLQVSMRAGFTGRNRQGVTAEPVEFEWLVFPARVWQSE